MALLSQLSQLSDSSNGMVDKPFHTQGQFRSLGLPSLSLSDSLDMQPLSPLSSSGISVFSSALSVGHSSLHSSQTNCLYSGQSSEYLITKVVWAGSNQAERKMFILQVWVHIIHRGFCITKCYPFPFWAHCRELGVLKQWGTLEAQKVDAYRVVLLC